MKKLYFLGILSFFFGLSVKAQNPILTESNHAPALGDTYTVTNVANGSTLTPGASGTSVNWNFAITTGTQVMNYSVVTTASTGSASAFPQSSVSVQTGTNNTFYSSSSTDLKLWGGAMTISGASILLKYSASGPAIVATYPMAYNSTTTSAISGSITAYSFTGSFTGNCNVKADGTGTLTLGTRSFSNVIRVVTSQTINFAVPPVIASGTVNLENYEYYSADYPKAPMFTISNATINTGTSPSAQTQATVRADYQFVGIKENARAIVDLRMYPNPAKDNLNVSFTNENASPASYEMINALGQTIRKENISSSKGVVKYSVNLDGIESGIYFVKINCGNSSSVQKVTVQ